MTSEKRVLADRFFIRVRGRVQGPLTTKQIRILAHRGRFGRHHEVSEDGTNWSRASAYPDLFAARTVSKLRKNAVEESPDAVETVDDSLEEEEEPETYGLVEPPQEPVELEPPIWHYTINSDQEGPVPYSQLQYLASAGQLRSNDLIWTEGMAEWSEASTVPGLFSTSQSTHVNVETTTETTTESLFDSSGASKTSPMAVASLVLAIVLPVIGSILAVVFGHVALNQIKQSQNTLGGRGMAIAGLILGYSVIIISVVIGIVLFFLFVFFVIGNADVAT